MAHGPLSVAQLDRFAEDGFLVVDGVFDASEVEAMRRAFERLERTATALQTTTMHRGSQFVVEPRVDGGDVPGVCIHRVVWCGAAEPVLSRLGRDPRLVSMGAQVLGSDYLEQLINQAHFKLPGDGVEFPWHQDSHHRRHGTDLWSDVNGRGSFVEIATAVDAMTPDNGPLRFIRGSARLGHLPADPVTGALPAELVQADQAVTLTMEAGSAVLFGPYVIHGSLPNRSALPRRLFLNGFAYPGANKRIYPGDGAGRVVSATG